MASQKVNETVAGREKKPTFMSTFLLPALLPLCLSVLVLYYLPSPLRPWSSSIAYPDPIFDSDTDCTIHRLSTSPPVLYIDSFLSPTEISHLLTIANPLFAPSRVFSSDEALDSRPPRLSSTCLLPSNDPVVKEVEDRIHALLVESKSFLPEHRGLDIDSFAGLENLQLVRYGEGEYFDPHYDWFDSLQREKGWRGHLYNRAASFFFYLVADCEGGETWFPKIMLDEGVDITIPVANSDGEGEKQEQILATAEEREGRPGLVFKPRAGSGVFWVNLDEQGYGDERTIHAGVPLKRGKKVGMNVWVKKSFGY